MGGLGLGSAWDAHWHVSVGRDSLWIPPHLLIIGGTALAGVLAAIGGLGHALQTGSLLPARVLPAPGVRGYGVVVAGAALLGAAIGIDELWHRTIGDKTIWSPPHVLAVIAGIVIGIGAAGAFTNAARRQILPAAAYRAVAGFFLAAILLAAYFGLLPAATMAILPGGSTLSFFSLTTPYFLCILAALMLPALVSGSQALLGRGGFLTVAGMTGLLWAVQEAFHLLATPLVAGMYGYVLRSAPGATIGFEALVLGFALLPALALAPLVSDRPLIGGAAMGVAYIVGMAGWLALAGRMAVAAPEELFGVLALSMAGAAAGGRAGRWIRQAADPD